MKKLFIAFTSAMLICGTGLEGMRRVQPGRAAKQSVQPGFYSERKARLGKEAKMHLLSTLQNGSAAGNAGAVVSAENAGAVVSAGNVGAVVSVSLPLAQSSEPIVCEFVRDDVDTIRVNAKDQMHDLLASFIFQRSLDQRWSLIRSEYEQEIVIEKDGQMPQQASELLDQAMAFLSSGNQVENPVQAAIEAAPAEMDQDQQPALQDEPMPQAQQLNRAKFLRDICAAAERMNARIAANRAAAAAAAGFVAVVAANPGATGTVLGFAANPFVAVPVGVAAAAYQFRAPLKRGIDSVRNRFAVNGNAAKRRRIDEQPK